MPDHVYELAPHALTNAIPLFAGATFDRAYVESFFQGRQIGRLFVDDPERPTGALLCRSFDYLTAGVPAPALRRFIADAPAEAEVFDTLGALSDAQLKPTIAFYGFVPMNDAWTRVLQELHPALETIGRRGFRYDGAPLDDAAWNVPDGFTLYPIDAPRAKRIDDEMGELIALFWGDYQNFAARGFGACAMHGDEFAAVAYAVTSSETETNIGVATEERFQRRGLGLAVCRATIRQAQQRGLRPTWDCDAENHRSGLLAERLGFVQESTFVELGFPHRRSPKRSTGVWSSEPTSTGVVWTAE